MSRKIDLTGQKFGRLTVLEEAIKKVFPSGQKQKTYDCICDCGNKVNVMASFLKTGHTKSCGCYAIDSRTKHGMTGTRPQRIHNHIKQRCLNENSSGYKDYGGRGIKVCERWKNSFKNFWEDMKEGYSDDLSIDRIDVNGDYYKENCRWVTQSQQTMNIRSHKDNVFSQYKGVSKSSSKINKWSARICKDYKTTRLGYFKTEIEAAKAYDKAAIELFGEYAHLNFKKG